MKQLPLWVAVIIVLLMGLMMIPFLIILWLLGVKRIVKKFEDFLDGILLK